MISFDTNILVYAYSTDVRRARALSLISAGGLISAQVLNEFTNVLRRKQQQDWPVIETALHTLRFRFPNILPLTADTHAAAVVLARGHGLAFYDALILASATEGGCDTLYSEDLQHGRRFGQLVVVNPFLGNAP